MALRRIQAVPPYSLALTTGAFTRFPGELVDRVEAGAYRRALGFDDGLLLVEARQPDGQVPEATVEIEILAGEADPAEGVSVIEWMLALDEPIDELQTSMHSDSRLRPLWQRLGGLRRVLDPSPVEGLVSSILAQLISIRGAAVIRSRLVQRFGECLNYDGREYWTFPHPSALGQSNIDELCSIGMTRAKANAILSVSQAAEAGELDRLQLDRHSDREIIDHLLKLPGVGPWTAEWFLINVMGRMSVVPSGDLGIRRSTGKWLLGEEMPSPERVREAYERFGACRAYVAYYVLSADRYRLDPPGTLDPE